MVGQLMVDQMMIHLMVVVMQLAGQEVVEIVDQIVAQQVVVDEIVVDQIIAQQIVAVGQCSPFASALNVVSDTGSGQSTVSVVGRGGMHLLSNRHHGGFKR